MAQGSSAVAANIKKLALEGIDLSRGRIVSRKDPFWQKLRAVGTELWLDTGDIDEASKAWSDEMTALTTNNTLLNKEVQKGIYDSFIKEANGALGDMPLSERIVEIAFILNARHGLRIAQKFGSKVSVELHTDLADDVDGIVRYGKRFFEICPDHFIIKVPLTASGLLGARRLREAGIPINFTLEFSARQNALVTLVAKPNYVNVFLGRLNAYVADNKLGSGELVGEKVTIASQLAVRKLSAGRAEPTRQIAASLRGADQLETLAGVDVYTMPTKVAEEGHATLSGNFRSRLAENYPVSLGAGVKEADVRLEKVWEVSEQVVELGRSLDREPPSDGPALAARARQAGLGDMFPELSSDERAHIASDGKIPRHDRWAERVKRGELAVDTLLNLAGLASFTEDQAKLDGRIRSLIA